MNDYVSELLLTYRSKGVIVDTNLLLLLLIGKYKPELVGIKGFKKVAQYTVEDYELLTRLISWFDVVVTTPHILTEVSNLAGQLGEPDKGNCFRKFATTFEVLEELQLIDSLEAALRNDFPYLGLTDAVIAEQANSYLVLSDDLRFIGRLEQSGGVALNFNHIRPIDWLRDRS